MESTRQKKIARLIQKDLGEIFQQMSPILFGNAFITVTQVYITPDLAIARIYLSIFMAKNPHEVLDKVREHTKSIRQTLAQRIKHQVRIIAELQFYIDDTEEVRMKVDELFKNLHIPPLKENQAEDEE